MRDCVVVIKSTVPIGTNDKIEKRLRDNLVSDVWVEVVSNPEFLSQGTAVKDTLYAARIVIGVESERAKEIMMKVYGAFQLGFLITLKQNLPGSQKSADCPYQAF